MENSWKIHGKFMENHRKSWKIKLHGFQMFPKLDTLESLSSQTSPEHAAWV
jgi:hypothetical protein